jgi:AcrR family transcriptional regulator
MLSEQSVIKIDTPRSRQKAATRRKIMQAARALYAEQGILATRSAEVSAAAGVAHGTLFLHFPSQEELLVAVIEDFGDGLCRRLHELSARGDGLEALLRAHLEGLREDEDFYARLATEASLLPEAARTSLVMIQSTVSYHIAKAAEAGMDAGSVRRQPVHLLFNTWVGLVHYYLANRGLFAPEGGVLERYGDELVRHYFRLVSTGEGAGGEES